MHVAEVLANGLAGAGIRHAFGIPGGEVLALMDALGAAGIEFVTARHETSAGLMAQGAWAAAARPGLLVVTVGPGVSNAVNAVANAYLDRIPMIVVSGAVALDRPGSYTHQMFDQIALLRPVVKGSFVAAPESIAQVTGEALALACAHPRGPVHIELPLQLAHAEAMPAAVSGGRAAVVRGDHSRVQEAARWLSEAERPLLLAGLEAVDVPAAQALRELVRARPLPVLTTYKAKGVVDEDDASCVGAIALSPKADAIAGPLLRAADVVVLIGYDPVEMRAAYAQPFAPHTRVIELAAAPRDHTMHRAQLEVIGDLGASLQQLSAALRGRALRPTWPGREPERARAALRASFAADDAPGLSPLIVAGVLSRCLPDDAYLTIDTGAHRIILSQAVRARWPGQVQQSNGLCTMGFALPCAVGLSLASGRRVVAAMGDGGFEMVAGEFATLRDLGVPVTCLVFDDSSLALIDLKQHAAGYERRGVWLGATDHTAVARAFGGRGVRATSAAELADALRAACAEPAGFTVISCALERGAYAGLL